MNYARQFDIGKKKCEKKTSKEKSKHAKRKNKKKNQKIMNVRLHPHEIIIALY